MKRNGIAETLTEDLNDEELDKLITHSQIEDWIDGQDVMQALHISTRSLRLARRRTAAGTSFADVVCPRQQQRR